MAVERQRGGKAQWQNGGVAGWQWRQSAKVGEVSKEAEKAEEAEVAL